MIYLRDEFRFDLRQQNVAIRQRWQAIQCNQRMAATERTGPRYAKGNSRRLSALHDGLL
jgi:hypothetical protein